MKKIVKAVLIILLAAVIICAAAFAVIYFTRFQTMATIEKLSDYDDGYNVYSMTVRYDYDTQKIIDSGFKDTQGFVDAVVKESLPLLPIKLELPSFGCSTYRAVTEDGDTIMGRNYDFKLDTSCLVIKCEPKNGYRSICCVALNNIGADQADAGLASKMACLSAPFSCLDGVNEKGVSVAVLTLDSEPTNQDTGREKITHSLAIRMILDSAATTQEAVDLLSGYDMLSVNGRDYHLFVSDASGDSRVIENDCESETRDFTVTPMQAITNFYAMYNDKVESHQKNGIYGHGKERYDYMMEVIDANDGVLSNENAWEALMAAATEPNPESVTSNTQWSIIFNNTDASADLTIRRHWGDVFSFPLDD